MKTKSFFLSVKAALRGLVYTFGRERNFRFEVLSAVLVLFFLFVLEANAREYIVIFFTITLVMVTELMNTVVERVVDILKPNKHPYARVIKDISAAMVLTASASAVVIGLMIFVPLAITFYTNNFLF